MNLRLALPDETENIRKLWDYCFDDAAEFNDWFFKNRYKSENTIVAVDNNNIASALQILPYVIQLRDAPIKTSYIVGVSTWPEYRGRGYITRLLYHTLTELRRRGEWISILLPFKYEFYRKYGWETCYSHLIFEGSVESFSAYAERAEISGQFIPVNKIEDLSLLNQSYLQFTKSLNGFVCRDNQDWIRLLDDIKLDKGHIYLYVSEGQILGYIIYYIQNKKFFIREMTFINEKTKLEIFKFVLAHSDIIDHIQWKAPNISDEKACFQKYGIRWNENPFVMGRIVDVKKALENTIVKWSEPKLNFTIKVVDPFLEWNNYTYKIKSVNENIVVSRTDQIPDFKIHITVLTQLLWGYVSAEQAVEYGLVKVYNADKLSQIFSIFCKTIPYIYEDY